MMIKYFHIYSSYSDMKFKVKFVILFRIDLQFLYIHFKFFI